MWSASAGPLLATGKSLIGRVKARAGNSYQFGWADVRDGLEADTVTALFDHLVGARDELQTAVL
jgi:hypothetical protein